MEPSTPFAGPDATSRPSWHHGGHFDHSFHDDSGYASEDSDSVPSLSPDPDIFHEDIDQFDQAPPWTPPHRAAAFVNAQWSRPAACRTCHPIHDSFDDSWRAYELPHPLPFEQQRNKCESGSWLKPSTCHNRGICGRRPGFTASRWDDPEEDISPLDFEEHRARVPYTLPSFGNRIESETEQSSPSSSSIRHNISSLEVSSKAPPSESLPKPSQPDPRTKNPMHSPPQRQCQFQPSSHDAQLAAAWQQLYQERMELDKEKNALKQNQKSSLRVQEQRCSNRRYHSDDNSW